jgi:hypothetical protein
MTDPTDEDDLIPSGPPIWLGRLRAEVISPHDIKPKQHASPNRNPWYVLATLYGEQKGDKIDRALHMRNRAVWNAWSFQNMSDAARNEAAAKLRVPEEELAEWPRIEAVDAEDHKKAWGERNGTATYPGLPDLTKVVDWRGVEFSNSLMMARCMFRSGARFADTTFDREVRFEDTTFNGVAEFNNVTFSENALFDGARFSGNADFETATFRGDARFHSAEFSSNADFSDTHFCRAARFNSAVFLGNAGFDRTTFNEDAQFDGSSFHGSTAFNVVDFKFKARFNRVNFHNIVAYGRATFNRDAEFNRSTFEGDAWFHLATFVGHGFFAGANFNRRAAFGEATFGTPQGTQSVIFADCRFGNSLNFRNPRFRARYPIFLGAITSDRNVFTAKSDHWPKATTQHPERARESCAAIRHMLDKQGLPEEAHFFFRREMEFAGQTGNFLHKALYRIYCALSNYGNSIMRPAIGLFVVIALGWALIRRWLESGDLPEGALRSTQPIPEALVLSVANTLPFLGLSRATLPDFHALAPPWLDLFSALQSLAGIVLLFLLGLGLRTRFRMR